MEFGVLNAMTEGMCRSVMMMVEVVMMIAILLVVAGLAIYLAGLARFCFEKKRPRITMPRTIRRSSPLTGRLSNRA